MSLDFEKLKIKEFSFWDLFLHPEQHPYIGRCYAWSRRENANFVEDMEITERDELYDEVLVKWSNTIKKLFNHDRTNIAAFGNTSNHLHYHFIPRYDSPRSFMGLDFIDPNPQGNYSPYEKKAMDEEKLINLKGDIERTILTF